MLELPPVVKITGTRRENIRNVLKQKYEKGRSIRSLAKETGRSYGFVYRILAESGVNMRSRGGVSRTKD